MALAETARYLTQLTLDDRLSPGLKRAQGNVGKFEGGIGRVGQGLGKMSSGLAKAGTRIAAGVGIGLAASAKAAIDWEDAFQGVVKTVDASDSDLKSLAGNLRDLSTRMPTSAIELAHIAEAAGQMGVGFDKATGKTNTAAIAAFTEQVAILASTTNVSSDDAAMALGQLTNVIHLGADEYDNFAASLVALGNAGASTESQILEITKRSGGAAAQIGIAKEETLAWSAAAANLGLNQELAGSALQRFFLQTQTLISKGGKPLERIAKIAGTSSKGFQKAFRKDATGALEDFLEGLGKLPSDKRLTAIQDLFGTGVGLNRLILGLTNDIDGLNQTLDMGPDSWFKNAAAAEEFAKRNATVQSAVSRLKNGLVDAAVSIGEGFAPALGRAADKLATFLRSDDNRKALTDLGKDIGKALDGIDWNEVLSGARQFKDVMIVALDYAKRIFDVINALPTEVKAAGAGFLVLDKLSGGLLGSGAGDVVGGLASALTKSLAASIPVFGKAFVQPVFVTNMGAGGLGGGGIAGGAGAMGGAAVLGTLGGAGLLSTLGNQLGVGIGNFINDVIPSPEPVKAHVHEFVQAWFDSILPNPGSIKRDIDDLIDKLTGGNVGGPAPDFINSRRHKSSTLGPLTGGPSSFSAAAARDEKFTQAIAGSKIAIVDQVRAAGDTFDRATSVASSKTTAGLLGVGSNVTSGTSGTTAAVNTGTSRILAGFHSIPPPIVNIDVNTNVSASDTVNTIVKRSRSGPTGGSRDGGADVPGGGGGGGGRLNG